MVSRGVPQESQSIGLRLMQGHRLSKINRLSTTPDDIITSLGAIALNLFSFSLGSCEGAILYRLVA